MNKTPIQLLLADDDKDDRDLFKDVLDEMQVVTNLVTVNDGEKLMQLLTRKMEALPDILFLDLNMPRKNGFECLSEIKHDKRLKVLPVIIFSTSFDREIIKLLHKNGANYYIRKPNEFEKLKRVIRTALSVVTHHGEVKTTLENFVLQP